MAIPGIPSQFKATRSGTSVTLTWSEANLDNVDTILIDRAPWPLGNFTNVGSVAAGTETWGQTIGADASYRYKIRASHAGDVGGSTQIFPLIADSEVFG